MKGTLTQPSFLVSEEHRKAFLRGSSVWNGTVAGPFAHTYTCMLGHILALWEGSPYTQASVDIHVCRLSVGRCS